MDVHRSMEGVTYTLGRVSLVFKRREENADRASSIIESTEAPGAGASLHRHGWEETFIVCQGHYEFVCGDDKCTLGPGDTVFVPRGTPHAFTCLGPETGRLFVVSTPGGMFEAFIRDVAKSVVDSGTPSSGPALDFRAVAAHHGVEFLT
jgi:mannose-6-phosphate isomerase-like protein (cupin superfamily)